MKSHPLKKHYCALLGLAGLTLWLAFVIVENQERVTDARDDAEEELQVTKAQKMILSEALATKMSSQVTEESPVRTFEIPLPPFEWTEFEDMSGCFWRRVPAERGKSIEFKAPAPFVFGRHFHPHSERVTLIDGFVLFGEPSLRSSTFMGPGDVERVDPGDLHFLRVLEDAVFRVDWPDLECEVLKISTQ